jgi:hypothetical protein
MIPRLALAATLLLTACGQTDLGLGLGFGGGGVQVSPNISTRVGDLRVGGHRGGLSLGVGL